MDLLDGDTTCAVQLTIGINPAASLADCTQHFRKLQSALPQIMETTQRQVMEGCQTGGTTPASDVQSSGV